MDAYEAYFRAKALYLDGLQDSNEFLELMKDQSVVRRLQDYIEERRNSAPPRDFDDAGNYIGIFTDLPPHYFLRDPNYIAQSNNADENKPFRKGPPRKLSAEQELALADALLNRTATAEQ